VEVSDDESLDENFELGDGIADTEATVHCPWCGEENEIAIDPGSGDIQEYVQDCEVCCRPWNVYVTYGLDGQAEVSVTAQDP
jgi:transposase-like protein